MALQYPDLAAEQCAQAVKTLNFRSIGVGDSVAGEQLAKPKFGPKCERLVRSSSCTHSVPWIGTKQPTGRKRTPNEYDQQGARNHGNFVASHILNRPNLSRLTKGTAHTKPIIQPSSFEPSLV